MAMSIDRIDSNSTINLMNLDDLVTFELGGDASARVAQCLLASARDTRDQTELYRAAAEQQLMKSEQKQVEEMYEQAGHIRAAGWIQGLSMIGSGACGAIGAINGLQSAKPNAPQTALAEAEYTASVFTNVGKGVEGGGALGRGLEDAAAKECEADASSAASSARHQERRLQDLERIAGDAREQARSAIESVAELEELQARQAQATLFIRG
jgi:hypothetical protein